MPRGRVARVLSQHFEENVMCEVNSGCWLWIGSVDDNGYGMCYANVEGVILRRAHQVAYHLYRGIVAESLEIDHLCRTPSCCNPNHLEAVPHAVNIRRSPTAAPALRARQTHCKRGHPLSGENLQMLKNGRRCRTCKNATNQVYAWKVRGIPKHACSPSC